MNEQGASSRQILVVDSDVQALETARSLLRAHRVSEASSISEAREVLNAENFDAAIIGPGLAHETGFEDSRCLLEARPGIDIIFVVDGLTTEVLRSALRCGFNNVLDAPLDRSKMELILRHIAKV